MQSDGRFTAPFFLTERRYAPSSWTQSEAVKGFSLGARLYGAPYGDAFRRDM